MGLASARNQAVQGIQAQSNAITDSSKNISNSGTVGFKASRVNFSTIITASGSSGGTSSGGVSASTQQQVDQQGLIESTGRATDIAISGGGFFPVQDDAGNLLLTRAGSFDTNSVGQLVNANGFTLLGWPLDENGLRPGELGNSNTTAAESVESLDIVDTNTANGTASATSTVSVGANLNAGQATFQGATATISFATASNSSLAADDVVGPASTMTVGDTISFTANSITTAFDYGGFSRSKDLSVTSVFGASAAGTTFATSTTFPLLTEGDRFTVTSSSSGTVTFTFTQSSPDTAAGQFNSLSSLATALDNATGLTARVEGNELFVSSSDANEALTFANVGSATLTESLGLGSIAASTTGRRFNTLNGLSTLIASESQIGSNVINPTASSTLEIFSSDPLEALTITKLDDTGFVSLVSPSNSLNDADDLIIPPDETTLTNVSSSMELRSSTLTLTDASSNTNSFVYGGIGHTDRISATDTIFGATSLTDAFTTLVDNGAGDRTVLTFDDGTNNVSATFVATNPDTSSGEFNNLTTLATVINADANFGAKVFEDRFYVGSTALPSNALTVEDDNATGGSQLTDTVITAQLGGTASGATATQGAQVTLSAASGGSVFFNSLSSLEAAIDADPGTTGITATATTGTDGTLTFSDGGDEQISVSATDGDQLLRELGLVAGDIGDQFFTELGLDSIVDATETSDSVAVSYDPSSDTVNMSGGNITAHFSRNVTVFDSLGTGHDFRLSFLKVGTNEWSVEFHALNADEIVGRSDGQVATGIVTFNGDGSLASVDSSLSLPVSISWSTGAVPSSVTFSLGTAGQPAGTDGATVIGLTDGLRQFDAAYNVDFVEQNGVSAGLFSGIEISDDGTVNARFSNGEIKPIYQIPVLTVANSNGLEEQTGNVYGFTDASGEANINIAGNGGAGGLQSSSVEQSTTDISVELTQIISYQAAFNANASVASTTNELEQSLDQRLG